MKLLLKKKYFQFTFFTFLSFLSFFYMPAFAYAGPGAALGALIVFATVVIAFFISVFLTSYKFIKKLFKKISTIVKKRLHKVKKQKIK